MGAVYVVEQVATGRERALELMHPGLVRDPRLRRRFEQEARPDCNATSRVVRGGDWADAEAEEVRASLRDKRAPDFADDRTGFRCARDAL